MQPEIRSLTSLRGVAAVLVAVFHFRLVTGTSLGIDDGTAFFANGYLWVDFFFVLSGFVIAYAYADEFDPRHGADRLRRYGRFLWRRLARLWPLHAFVLVALLPTELAKYWFGWHDRPPFAPGNTPAEFLGALVMVHSWAIYDHLVWNWPSWSISAEWSAYLFFPLLLTVFYRPRLGLVLATLPLPLLGLVALVALHPQGDLDLTFSHGVERCLLSFALGIAGFRIWEVLQPMRDRMPVGWLLGAAGLATILAMHFDLHPVLVVAGFAVVVPLAGLAGGRLATVLGAAPLHYLGLISYSIYLIQYPVQRVVYMLTRSLHPEPLPPAMAAAVLLNSLELFVGLSALTYRFVELPGRRFLRNHPPRLSIPPFARQRA